MEEEIDIFKNQLLEVIKEARKNQKLTDTEFEQLQDTIILENIIRLLYPIGYTLKIIPLSEKQQNIKELFKNYNGKYEHHTLIGKTL